VVASGHFDVSFSNPHWAFRMIAAFHELAARA
jgi:hypothetical protein